MTETADRSPVKTHCPYCSLQCGMAISRKGRAGIEIGAWDEFPVNEGAMCRKGWTAGELRGSRERLTTPMIRDRATGELRAADWDEALDHVARRLAVLQAEQGNDAVAIFGGGGLTNEKSYQLGKFARVALGTSQIDYNGRWCMSSAASAGNQAFGVDRGLPFPLAGHRAGRRGRPRRVQHGRDDAAGRAPPRPPPRARRQGRRHRPAPHLDGRACGPVPAAGARNGPGPRPRRTPPARRAGSDRRGLRRPRAPPASTRSAARWPPGGPSASSAPRAWRPTSCARWSTCSPATRR